MEVKQYAAVEPRNGMSKRAGNVSLLTLRAWTQMGKRIKAEKRVQARRSDVIPSGGKPDKPKEESKA